MKLLKIDNNQGLFLVEEDEHKLVDKITKEDLLRLVDLTLTQEDIEFDEYNADLLKNPAHQIIYKNVFENLKSLQERKDGFLDDTETLYLAEYERYKQDGEPESTKKE